MPSRDGTGPTDPAQRVPKCNGIWTGPLPDECRPSEGGLRHQSLRQEIPPCAQHRAAGSWQTDEVIDPTLASRHRIPPTAHLGPGMKLFALRSEPLSGDGDGTFPRNRVQDEVPIVVHQPATVQDREH